MPEFQAQEIGLPGQQCNMIPATMISRLVEGADFIGFGLPVYQGTNDKGVTGTAAAGKFIGITVRQSDKGAFEPGCEARIMTEGAIWVKVKSAVVAGDAVAASATGFAKSGGTALANARFETSAAANGVAQVRLWGAGAA